MANIGSEAYNSENGPNNLFFIDLRVYIAGVLIPTNSVYITSAFSNIPTATITLPPYQELFTIGRRDRVPVHIFMANRFIKDSPDNYENKPVKTGDAKYQVGEPLLIFEGEISGFGYLSDGGGRDMVINASSHFSFLRDVKMEFITSRDAWFNATLSGMALTTLQVNALADTAFPLALFTSGLKPGEPLEYPTKLLENLIKLIVDANFHQDQKDPDSNALVLFYKKYVGERLKCSNRLVKLPYIDSSGFPLLNMVQTDQLLNQFNAFLREGLPENGGTLWDIINAVFSRMEYDINIQSAPTYNPTLKILKSIIAKPMFHDALPPKCNIIFRNQIKTLRVDESVQGVPTRIRMKDIDKTVISYSREGDYTDLLFRLNFYPSKFYNTPTPKQEDSKFKLFASEILEAENYTGPYLIDVQAPPWTTFVNTGQFDGTTNMDKDKQYKMTLMKSMLMLKVYEHRQITATLDFNPFIVVGAPAILFDVIPNGQNTEGLTFLGYVISCNHAITRNSLRTTITLGYTRIIQEDFVPDTRLYNVYKPLSTETTHDQAKMTEIYNTMFGCEAMPVGTTTQDDMYRDFYNMYYLHGIQDNPKDSYAFQERRLCTFDEYLSFMKLKVKKEEKNEDGDKICLQFTDGDGIVKDNQYIADRNDGELIAKLVVVQEKCLSNKIYNKV